MKTIGIEINNDKAILFVLEKDGTTINEITGNFKQLKLDNDKNNDEMRTFQSVIFSHFDSINPDRIAILTKQSRGKFASSSVSFKIEALIQCYTKVNIEFVSPRTLDAYYKKNNFDVQISYNYQEKAAKLSKYLISN
ncbi:DUF3010 family protein [Capnocytophaga cynodegmi]|uniref:DUF3010 family protein n=1 Tax=Capnocytophaga cynodegmi TaxID=28189 RepID=UPI0037D084ED